MSSRKQTLSLFDRLNVYFTLYLSSIKPSSSLTSPRNIEPPPTNANMKFSQILGNFPVCALPVTALSVFHQQLKLQIRCFTESQQFDSQIISFPKTAKPEESKSNDGAVTTNFDM